jgi:glucose/arabinose dehydrogenase
VADAPDDPVTFEAQVIAQGLVNPWGVAFLPDGRALVTEQEGRLRLISAAGTLEPQAITGVPQVRFEGQGGLLDVAIHPRFATNGLVYLTVAEGTQASNGTSLAVGRLEGAALRDVRVIWRQTRKSGDFHFGGRIAFLPDGTLLVSLGEGYSRMREAQQLDTTFGKIVRLRDDGTVPPDNPHVGRQGVAQEIWSHGHRNVQGLVVHAATGRVFAHEHGPRGGDEVNLILPGRNYGWPAVTSGVDYSGAVISPIASRPGIEDPLTVWVPSIAPSGMALYEGRLFPAWQGDLLVGALAGQQVRRVDLDQAGRVVGQTGIARDRFGRIRDVRQAPDGSVWLLTDSPEGQVIRLAPAA